MKVEETRIKGCYIIVPDIYFDERGSFMESYNKRVFEESIGLQVQFVQDNQSISKRGALRGLHFQKGKYAQAKLVRVTQGNILDVIVDIRKDSKTFGEHLKIELNATANEMLFIPKGIAHGFVTLSEEATFLYKCDQYYNKDFEGGIIYNDVDLNIDWEHHVNDLIISHKDRNLPTFKELAR